MTGRRSLAPSHRALAVGYCLALAVSFAPQCDATAAARLRGLGRSSPPSEPALSSPPPPAVSPPPPAVSPPPPAVSPPPPAVSPPPPAVSPPPPAVSPPPPAVSPPPPAVSPPPPAVSPPPPAVSPPPPAVSPPPPAVSPPPPAVSPPPPAVSPPPPAVSPPPPAVSPPPPAVSPPPPAVSPPPPAVSPPPPAVSPPPPAVSPPPPAVSPPPPAVSRPPALRSPAPPQPSAPPPSVDVTAVLSKINNLRARHGAAALTWSPTLERFAQSYADRCLFEHSNGPYGETLGLGNIITVIDQWYEEICIYNYNQPGWSPRTGHFTQLIWAKTTRLGCAVGNCPSGSRDNSGNFFNGPVVVCEWDPWGNGSGFSTNARPLLPGATNICAAGK
ncbi:CAP domain-containing protein [Haematococcus lacustris]